MRPEARLHRLVRRIEGWWYGTSLFTSHQKVMQLRVYCLLTGGHRWTNFTGPLADAFPDFCAKCVADRPAAPMRPDMTAGLSRAAWVYLAVVYGVARWWVRVRRG